MSKVVTRGILGVAVEKYSFCENSSVCGVRDAVLRACDYYFRYLTLLYINLFLPSESIVIAMKQRRHTRRGRRGGTRGKNQRQQQPISGIMTARATTNYPKTAPHGVGSASCPLTDILVRPLLVECLMYLDQPSLREVCLLSTVFRDIVCNDKGMRNHRVIPLLEIRLSNNNKDDESRLVRLIQQLYCQCRDKLQHYREVRIIDAHKFVCNYFDMVAVGEYTTKLQLNGVVSLMCINSSSTPLIANIQTDILAVMMPNLREVNMPGSSIYGTSLIELSKHCSCLEKLTCNNVQPFTYVHANGMDMVHAKNLRELNMDNSSFSVAEITRAKMSDLENSLSLYDDNSTIFLFHKCGSTVLERVSIKNAMWYDIPHGSYDEKHTVIPQNALIKFIRNAPASLRYFGSDLSQENIEMLRLEGGRGSEIEFG